MVGSVSKVTSSDILLFLVHLYSCADLHACIIVSNLYFPLFGLSVSVFHLLTF